MHFTVSRKVQSAVTAMTLAAAGFGLVAPASAQRSDELVITITSVRAIDKTDIFGKADFYAKVTIDGETTSTPVARQADSARPNWVVAKRVSRGKHDVRIQLLDKDPGKPDDVIDINRVANKRELDFQVDTSTCRISGFSSAYRCNTTIVREGTERKKAEIQFRVSTR